MRTHALDAKTSFHSAPYPNVALMSRSMAVAAFAMEWSRWELPNVRRYYRRDGQTCTNASEWPSKSGPRRRGRDRAVVDICIDRFRYRPLSNPDVARDAIMLPWIAGNAGVTAIHNVIGTGTGDVEIVSNADVLAYYRGDRLARPHRPEIAGFETVYEPVAVPRDVGRIIERGGLWESVVPFHD